MFDKFDEVFFTKKFEKLAEVHNMRENMVNTELVAVLESSKGENGVLCHYYAEIARLIATCGGAVIKYHHSE